MLNNYSRNITSKPLIAITLLIVQLILVGCASEPDKITQSKPISTPQTNIAPRNALNPPVGSYFSSAVTGDYAGYVGLDTFITEMVQKYGYKREYLQGLFSQAKRKQWTLDYLAKSDQGMKGKPAAGGWTRYRTQFLDDHHVDGGIAFWHKHQDALARASQKYGVAPAYILGIIGVETGFGANFGNHRIIDALTTLSFDYQRRGDYFRSELENFLVMTNNERLDPLQPRGSFAGAMGYGQFMPSSFLKWAVDFNGDGRIDLWNPEDAIGSVAHYFAEHGWQAGQPVVSPIQGSKMGIENLEPGIDHPYSLSTLQQAGVEPVGVCNCDYPLRLILLRHQHHDEYWLGHPNFYTISRYNHSTYYVMAVHELARAIKYGYAKG